MIFGATGDLTARKLLPALYHLLKDGQLPRQCAVVGVARREQSQLEFRTEMKQALLKFSRTQPVDETVWHNFEQMLFYHRSEFHADEGYIALAKLLQEIDCTSGMPGNRLFYLATQPSYFITIAGRLHNFGLIRKANDQEKPWSRIVIEKPFGRDLLSAKSLQTDLLQFVQEKQIFRIDHYLGKATAQNILVLRFANSIFESLWNHHYIDHVQITMAEDIGIGTRGQYYEETGLLRDMMQNHMMQLLCLLAMESPSRLEADPIRDKKVEVLHALRPFDSRNLYERCVFGQYGPGKVGGETVLGYREEKNVAANSSVETYLALKLYIDNARWQGVPFYLRSGKRLSKKVTEIAISFKAPPTLLFKEISQRDLSNLLLIRIQPNEGITLQINSQIPISQHPITSVNMDFLYETYYGRTLPEAYERLLLDCILDDRTLFARDDEVLQSWELFDPLLNYHPDSLILPNYAAGEWGPKAADTLIERDDRKWRNM